MPSVQELFSSEKAMQPKDSHPPLGAKELRRMLSVVMDIPGGWVVTMVILAVLSCFAIEHPASGGWSVSFSVGTTTVGVIALIWLPALLRLLALTGGRVKAAGVEASAAGFLGSNEELIEGLTNIRTVTEEAELAAPRSDQTLQAVLAQVDQMAAQFVEGATAIPDDVVARLAEQYEDLRRELSPGDARTVEMTRIVNEARVRASADREKASRLGSLLIRSKREGQRIVGLAFLQEAPDVSTFEDVLGLVQGSATAFEMFHGLLALDSMAPHLSKEERDRAIEALRSEATDPRGVGVREDTSLPGLIDEVRADLESA